MENCLYLFQPCVFRYVDVSKDQTRQDNPIFYRPLARHEKLPKYLRDIENEKHSSERSQALGRPSECRSYRMILPNSFIPKSSWKCINTTAPQRRNGAMNVSSSSSTKSLAKSRPSLPHKRQYVDGRKVCRCGSTTHKNTLHK